MKERYFVLVRDRSSGGRWRFARQKIVNSKQETSWSGPPCFEPFETSDFAKAVIKAISSRSDELEGIIVQQVEP